jgi:hypothetical protein
MFERRHRKAAIALYGLKMKRAQSVPVPMPALQFSNETAFMAGLVPAIHVFLA